MKEVWSASSRGARISRAGKGGMEEVWRQRGGRVSRAVALHFSHKYSSSHIFRPSYRSFHSFRALDCTSAFRSSGSDASLFGK